MLTTDTTIPADLDLALVDLDDLRTAFGGQAQAPVQDAAAVPTSTVMCPSW